MLLQQVVSDHRKRPAPLPRLRLRRKLWFGPGTAWSFVLIILGAQCLVGTAFAMVTELVPSTWPAVVRAALAPIALILMLATMLGLMMRLAEPSPQATIEYALAEARCPSCAYDLRKCAPEPDGCTVCPECGAAWRLPQQPQPEPGSQP